MFTANNKNIWLGVQILTELHPPKVSLQTRNKRILSWQQLATAEEHEYEESNI